MGAVIREEFSTYLNAVRFTAALAVVAGHLTFAQFIAGIPYQGALAGAAVSCFFVLSGYVITYVAHEKEKTLKQYVISRMARIYSVAIPAILLTLVIDLFLIRHHAAGHIPLYEYKSLWKYLPVFLVFGSDIGGFHAPVLGDDAFWSLSYEVWYYVAFAAFFYLTGLRRVIFGLLAIAILGLPALIYFPMWLLGVAVYRLHQVAHVPRFAAIAGAICSAVALAAAVAFGILDNSDAAANALLHGWPKLHLHNSMNFASFYIAAVLAGMNIFCVRYCRLAILSGHKTRQIITKLAGFTFAIYLAHWPLLRFWAFLMHHDPHSVLSVITLAAAVLLSCLAFGFASEGQKDRWRRLFGRAFDRLWPAPRHNALYGLRGVSKIPLTVRIVDRGLDSSQRGISR